jgi:hypothetical protein
MLWQPARLLILLITACLLAALLTSTSAAGNDQPPPGKTLAQSGDAYVAYDDQTLTWEIGTAGIGRRMDYDYGSGLHLASLKNKLTGREWLAPNSGASSELRTELDGQIIEGSAREFTLRDYGVNRRADGSIELEIHLTRGLLVVHLHYAVFPNTSIIDRWVELENSSRNTMRDLTALDFISFSVSPSPDPLTLYWVEGLNPPDSDKTEPHPDPVLALKSAELVEGSAIPIGSNGRSSEDSVGWFVLALPSQNEGLFSGIEWSGAWLMSAGRKNGQTALDAELQGLDRDLAPGEIFESPHRFLGFYRGDLDDASNATHTFVRQYLMRPRPTDWPWTQFNTWFAYYTDLN